MRDNYFLQMICALRKQEEVILHANVLSFTDQECLEVADFLRMEYESELPEYPEGAPGFLKDAALWSAKVIYTSSQLMLYREHRSEDLHTLIKPYAGEVNAAAIISADLCLRFIPDILINLKMIDSEDPLITILEDVMMLWSYSGIASLENITDLNLHGIGEDKCLMQMYTDRIISTRNKTFMSNKKTSEWVAASLGMYADHFWKDHERKQITNEQG